MFDEPGNVIMRSVATRVSMFPLVNRLSPQTGSIHRSVAYPVRSVTILQILLQVILECGGRPEAHQAGRTSSSAGQSIRASFRWCSVRFVNGPPWYAEGSRTITRIVEQPTVYPLFEEKRPDCSITANPLPHLRCPGSAIRSVLRALRRYSSARASCNR